MTTEEVPRDQEATTDLELAVVRFRGEDSAANALYEARQRAGAEAPWMRHVGLVEHYAGGTLTLRGVFAGHFVDVDEGDHLSEPGAAKGFTVGGLIGLLGGPPGLAVGMVLGTILGSQLDTPTVTEPEPHTLADQLRKAVPRSSSALVMIGAPAEVDQLLSALGDTSGEVIRQPLSSDQVAKLNASLEEEGAVPVLDDCAGEVSGEKLTPDQLAKFKGWLDAER
jgi:uncharacterized membrane protein